MYLVQRLVIGSQIYLLDMALGLSGRASSESRCISAVNGGYVHICQLLGACFVEKLYTLAEMCRSTQLLHLGTHPRYVMNLNLGTISLLVQNSPFKLRKRVFLYSS